MAERNTVPSDTSAVEQPSIGYARRFQELAVYQEARTLTKEVFVATADFPREEAFSLTDQIRRASRSIGAQIAEAWAKRKYPKHFVSKLTDADGEQLETQHWITVAFDCGLISREETHRLGTLCLEIGRMLGAMIARSDHFCCAENGSLKEETTPYTTADNPALLTDY